jgi:mannose-6-phosphate isomerase-like protein (cupin superfamily)
LANVNLVKVLPGNKIPRHHHAEEIETVFVLAGYSQLTLGDIEVPFNAGQVVAIPKGLDHALVNMGQEPVELITFFTPPIV